MEEGTKDMENEGPETKRIKLDSADSASEPPQSPKPNSAIVVGNGNNILPCIENDEELQRVLELDNSSSSEGEDSSEEADDEQETNDPKSVDSNHDSLSATFEDVVEDSSGAGQTSSTSVNPRKRKKVNIEKSDNSSGSRHVKTMRNSSKRKAANLRKNIKDILKTEHLGEETLAAQREEAERRQRMNLKLQAQQQQLKMLHQQQAQFVKESGLDVSDNGFSNLSLDEIMMKIAQKKHLTVSIEPAEDSSRLISKQPKGQVVTTSEEIVLLSSDDEEEGISLVDRRVDNRFCNPNEFQWPVVQSTNHFGGTVTSPQDDDNIISISSGDEDERDVLCDQEVESLGRSHCTSVNNAPAPVTVDSDDDCVVISPTPDNNDVDKDERNQDELNVLDEFGRVLVNVGHPDEDPDIFLAPQVSRVVKPHQV